MLFYTTHFIKQWATATAAAARASLCCMHHSSGTLRPPGRCWSAVPVRRATPHARSAPLLSWWLQASRRMARVALEGGHFATAAAGSWQRRVLLLAGALVSHLARHTPVQLCLYGGCRGTGTAEQTPLCGTVCVPAACAKLSNAPPSPPHTHTPNERPLSPRGALSSCLLLLCLHPSGRGHTRLVQAILEAAVLSQGLVRAKQRCINHTNSRGHSALNVACQHG